MSTCTFKSIYYDINDCINIAVDNKIDTTEVLLFYGYMCISVQNMIITLKAYQGLRS